MEAWVYDVVDERIRECEKGEEMLAKLIILLSKDGRLSDVIKVSQGSLP